MSLEEGLVFGPCQHVVVTDDRDYREFWAQLGAEDRLPPSRVVEVVEVAQHYQQLRVGGHQLQHAPRLQPPALVAEKGDGVVGWRGRWDVGLGDECRSRRRRRDRQADRPPTPRAGVLQAPPLSLCGDDAAAVERVIDSHVLPTGSYAIKRNTRLNISLNAYVGAGATYEWATDETVPADARGFGGPLHAPVGIAVSTGLADASSLSLFLVAVDLAVPLAITALSVDQANGVPELKLENMLAPGGYLAYGLAESPVTIAAGISIRTNPHHHRGEHDREPSVLAGGHLRIGRHPALQPPCAMTQPGRTQVPVAYVKATLWGYRGTLAEQGPGPAPYLLQVGAQIRRTVATPQADPAPLD